MLLGFGVGEGVGVGVFDGPPIGGVPVGVALGERLGVADGLRVGVALGERLAVLELVGEAFGVRLGEAERVGVGRGVEVLLHLLVSGGINLPKSGPVKSNWYGKHSRPTRTSHASPGATVISPFGFAGLSQQSLPPG